jgi:succinate dehydrogenase / fumarate reductase cytochrome b subunit
MNAVALIWPGAYNAVCEFLGANWYALVASLGLAALFIIHIIYALWLTVQNRRARGVDRYAVSAHYPGVEWSSKNMLVLGIVVLAFLVVHMVQFWSKMQLQELLSHNLSAYPTVNGLIADPAYGTLFLELAFSQWYTPVIYIIGFIALWFHMNHGFWSMFQTIGWNNNTWLPRLKKIALWWTSIVVALFIAQAIVFTVRANQNYYTTNEALVEQYAKGLAERAEEPVTKFMESWQALQQQAMYGGQQVMEQFIAENGQKYLDELAPIADAAKAMPAASTDRYLSTAIQIVDMLREHVQQAAPAQETVAVEETVVEETTDSIN